VSLDGRSIAPRLDHTVAHSRGRSGASLGEMSFPNQAASVHLVRRFVGLITEAYGVAHIGDTASLLVSELAGNATKHARDTADGRFEVVVSRRGNRLRVEVRDGSSRLPVMRYFDTLNDDGRGLFLVSELADGHGSYRLPRGKAVWFELVAWGTGGKQAMVPGKDMKK
jgi:anti-sigma regulatory factor (Ser/Thr protein kinase)